MTHSWMAHWFEWPYSLEWLHSLKWSIHLKVSFSRPIHLNDPFIENDPFTQMTHSLKWCIHLNDPFARMTHSLEWPIQLKIVLSTSFFLNISNSTLNFILNRFLSAQTSSSMLKLLFSSTKDALSLEWPIQHLKASFSRPIHSSDLFSSK